ncbi:nucleoside triphosphate pyrophosphohydrolase [Oceanobacillus chungangensis]|uniref:Phosphoribosyl-ATP pyrophosphohydrolase n=1 Tax=Oceanobacillus chungangensis TaxID=1229152 RepID=A0A3D8PT31_9BACI|nr:nucleoside triphosphate pyrophosphohydrolase [Oceanobacillus chungangensis]RDW18862.1 phosphoribosyl-ATP pyrophosphohydrolase [Oceanobacillus chungangensis]
MTTYNKLVRDRIPEIIEKSGKDCKTETLNQDRYILELKKKLFEEVEEYQQAATKEDALEEIADLLEIINTLVKDVHGSSMEKVEKIRSLKAEKHGSYVEKVFLLEVED